MSEADIIERFLKMKTLLVKEYEIDLYVNHGKIYIYDPEGREGGVVCSSLDKVEGYISALTVSNG